MTINVVFTYRDAVDLKEPFGDLGDRPNQLCHDQFHLSAQQEQIYCTNIIGFVHFILKYL